MSDITADREKLLFSRGLNEDDVTDADIIFNLATSSRNTLHVLLGLIEQEHGRDAAETIAHRAGFLAARALLRATQERVGHTELSFDDIAHFEDVGHKLLGPFFGGAKARVESDTCIVYRTACLFNAPTPRTKHLGAAYERGQMDAFTNVDPGLRIECTHCLQFGDDYCEHRFTRADDAAIG